MSHPTQVEPAAGIEIAIVGMAGRFPGAKHVETFWNNIRDGVESVSSFSDEALQARGVSADVLGDPSYVKAGVVLGGMDQFDARFFGYSPREAEYLDPQQRLFLETAWEALEHAGYDSTSWPKPIGVYVGSGFNVYLLRNLLPSTNLAGVSDFASLLGLMNGNDKDSLSTRVAYKLNLRGPAVSVQTACSTSLAAVHLACRGLLNHEADMALAGGVWLNLLQDSGYRYQAGAILSPDGHCRAFDAKAAGTAIGSGAGVVVLKRLADALVDGDTIHAVIKGSALNNDGSAKVGYTAPSIEGQAEVILAAQAIADVPAETISYVEAHGTGTTLGDPIEIAALTQAFRTSTNRRGFCGIGSVKTNVGHLDAAAGVTGLIKTVMALKHKTLPPSLNFDQPNPQIDFANGPFYVNTQAKEWLAGSTPRRAGISAFGIGGTNVHVILEEAPPPRPSRPCGPTLELQLLMLSARSSSALDVATRQLAEHLGRHAEQALPDVAYTLRAGRKRFDHRAVAPGRDHGEAIRALEGQAAQQFFTGQILAENPTVAFLFPGQGAQHVDMGRSLYQSETVFRDTVDRCCALLAPQLGVDLRELLYPNDLSESEASARLEQTAITQPALFVVEYALAQLWIRWGLRPDAMMGHSIGEYVAACLAGVFSLTDALTLVAARGRLLQAMRPGAMTAVSLSEAELRPCLNAGCDLAAVNASQLCVLSGTVKAIEAVERDLAARDVAVRRLRVSHAFHSALMEPMLAEFEALSRKIELRPPQIPFVSNVNGRWITPQEACSAGYWVRHVRSTVRFAEGLDELFSKRDRILLEVGPGETLSSLAKRHPAADAGRPILASQAHPNRRDLNPDQPARCVAQLWVAGVEIDWRAFCGDQDRRRVPLPTYPFERQSYWIAPLTSNGTAKPVSSVGPRDIADWFYVPTWKRTEPLTPPLGVHREASGCILVLGDSHSLTDRLIQHLRSLGDQVVRAERGRAFARMDKHRYVVRPGERADHEQVLRSVEAEIGPVSGICHLWSLDAGSAPQSQTDVLEQGFFSLLALTQALDATRSPGIDRKIPITVVANQLEDVTGLETLCPEKATLHGPCKVIPQEYSNISCRVIDVVLPASESAAESQLLGQIVAEMRAAAREPQVAYRGPHRWIKAYEPTRRDAPVRQRLRKSGVYLITGGLGGIGLALAEYLAQNWQARLVLFGRTALPAREKWVTLIAKADQSPALRQKLQQLIELETLGAQVMTVQADVADPTQLRAAMEQARQRFGAFHGVIHAAGEAGGGMIAHKTRALVKDVFAPKVCGTQALMEALRNEALDFVLFCSSLASIAGGLAKVDYTAASAYLDATAAVSRRSSNTPVFSVNWDGWREVGMAAGMRLPEHVGIGPKQGARAFERIVNGPDVPQTIVSTTDLVARLGQLVDGMLLVVEPKPFADATRRSHPRQNLQTSYVAPAGDLENRLADIWSDLLGISPIGVSDNLFELGGDSLLAIQVLARVRGAYGVELHPADFFKTPTIAALVVLLETRLIEEIENAGSAQAEPDRASATV